MMDQTPPVELEVLELAYEGNQSAIQQILKVYTPYIESEIRRLMPYVEYEQQKDDRQEVYLKLYLDILRRKFDLSQPY